MSANEVLRDVDFDVAPAEVGRPLDGVLRARLAISWERARQLVKRGKVSVNGERATDSRKVVPARAKVSIRPGARRQDAGSLEDARIAYVDLHVVVVHKPAGVSTIPYEPGERGTLEELTHKWVVRNARHSPQASLGVVHRIDRETSGLVVFARTLLAKKMLSQAFRDHTIERRYVAVVHGRMTAARSMVSYLVADRGDGLRGTARDPGHGARLGQRAVTHVAPWQDLGPEATLVACGLETGRTHQIRIHLAEAGMPLVGDRVYTRDWLRAGRKLLEAPRLMLHAMVLGFAHPVTQQALRFSAEVPDDLRRVVQGLAGREVDLTPAALPSLGGGH